MRTLKILSFSVSFIGICTLGNAQIETGEVPVNPVPKPNPEPPTALPPGVRPLGKGQAKPVPPLTPERVPMISATGRTPAQVDKANKSREKPGVPAVPGVDPTATAKLPYQELIRIAKSDSNQPKDAQIYILKITSSIEGVKPSDIKLRLDDPDLPMDLPVSEEGYFQVPYSIDRYEKNPFLVANQPKGSLQISVKLELPKVVPPKVVDGKVSYQELFRPVLEMSEAMSKVDKTFGKEGQQQFALEILTGGEPVVVKRSLSTRKLEANDKGAVYMVYERLLYEENPEVLVPEKTTVNVRPVSPKEALWIRAQ